MKQKHKPVKQIERKATKNLETQYEQLFGEAGTERVVMHSDLRQPSIYTVVKTVTTYGAYEDPI